LTGSVADLEEDEDEGETSSIWRWTKTGSAASYEKAWLAIRELCARDETGVSHEEPCNMCVAVRVKPADDSSGVILTDTHRGEHSSDITLRGGDQSSFGPFPFDMCFDSTDEGVEALGSQEAVFRQIGMDLLSNAWSGYNVSLISYGSAGSGRKSINSLHQCTSHTPPRQDVLTVRRRVLDGHSATVRGHTHTYI
jgi:hypothetical protein